MSNFYIDELPSGKYRARFQDSDGKWRSRSRDKKAEVREWAIQGLAAAQRGEHVSTSRATVAEVAAEQVAGRTLTAGTRRRYESVIRNHLVGTPLGAAPITKVRATMVQSWLTSRQELGLAPGTVGLLAIFVKSVFAWAVEDQLIPKSPWPKRLKVPKPSEPVGRTLTATELAALVEATPARYKALVTTQAGLGLRIGEVVALRVSDVDWLRSVVTVSRMWDEGTRTFVDRTKSRKADAKPRKIELPESVKATLAEHLARFPSGDLIFKSAIGGPVLPNTYRPNTFTPSLVRAGLDRSIRPHDLRHTFGSVLISDGWSATEVAEVMGNSAEVVLSTYAHVLQDRRRSVAATIDRAFLVTAVVTDDATSL